MTNSEIMQVLNKSIKEVFTDYKGLYLYGSKAKDSSISSGDYDIVLLTNNKLSSVDKQKIYIEIGRLEYNLNIFIDIQILRENEFTANPFFYNEVVKYGKFYAA